MPKFLFKASYNADGASGIAAKGGTARRDALEQLFESSGGRLEAVYFAFGEYDLYAFGDLPDNETAAAIALTTNADGKSKVTTVVLATPEEIDAAAQKSIDYRSPGT